MDNWTPRRRMMAAYFNEMPDRPGLAIYERYLPRSRAERLLRAAGLGLIGYVPLTTQIGPAWHMLPGYPSPIDGASFKSEFYRDARGALREKRGYLTPVGELWQDVGPGIGAGSEHIAEYLIKEERDYATMQWLVEHTRLTSNESRLLTKQAEYGEDGVVFGRLDRTPYQKVMIELAGGECFLTDLYSDCEELLSLLNAMAVRYREQIERAMESAAELIWIPDNVTVDMTPPARYAQFHAPLYEYAIRCARQAGKKVMVHCDGKIRPLVPAMRRLGFHAIESVSDPMVGGDMAFGEAADALPGTAIVPNFPANLANAPEVDILRFLNGLSEDGKRHPLLLQISEDLPEDSWSRIARLSMRALWGAEPSLSD